MSFERPIFRDREVDARFKAEGFAVVPAASPELVEELRSVVEEVHVGERDGFHATIRIADPTYRQAVFEELGPRFQPIIDELLDGYEAFTYSLLVKWPTGDNEFVTHQDWSFVDEREHRSVNLWLALDDLDERNGTLGVLPRSHIHLDYLRCSPGNPDHYGPAVYGIGLDDMDLVPVRAGELLAFDGALLHASGRNDSGAPRRVVVAACKPVEAKLLHYFHPPEMADDQVEVFEVAPEFLQTFAIGDLPVGRSLGTEPYRGAPRTREQLLALCRGDAPPAADGVERHPTFADPELQERLERDGVVLVDLLDDAVVEQLRALSDELFVDQREGFHASNMSSAHEYRQRVDEQIRPIIEAAVDEAGLFVDHEAFTASLLVKWPGDDSAFHTHQDWTMVDEERFRTVNVWCPLVDTDEENGAFAALLGSHRVLRAIRCSPMPPASYHSPGWGVGHEQMTKLPVRAGQALVFDHALLHSSPPNRTESWRPAVAAAFRPRSSSLVHYYLPAPDAAELEVFEVEPAFFATFDIGDRPAYPAVGAVAFVPDALDTAGLLERCGAVAVAERPEPAPDPEATDEPGAPVGPPASPAPTSTPAPPAPAPSLTAWQRVQILGSKPKRRILGALGRR